GRWGSTSAPSSNPSPLPFPHTFPSFRTERVAAQTRPDCESRRRGRESAVESESPGRLPTGRIGNVYGTGNGPGHVGGRLGSGGAIPCAGTPTSRSRAFSSAIEAYA